MLRRLVSRRRNPVIARSAATRQSSVSACWWRGTGLLPATLRSRLKTSCVRNDEYTYPV